MSPTKGTYCGLLKFFGSFGLRPKSLSDFCGALFVGAEEEGAEEEGAEVVPQPLNTIGRASAVTHPAKRRM